MKILHTGDIHLGELTGPVSNGQNARMIDTVRCMDHLAVVAQAEQPDAILIAGDLFHRSRLWADQMLTEIGIASQWLRKLAAIAPTVLLFGTKNHDNQQAFNNISSMGIPNLEVITHPQLITLQTKSGLLQVAAVPGFDKGYFRAQYPGMDPAEENAICSQLLGAVVLGLSTQLNPQWPSVLMSHYTVTGCELDNGQHVYAAHEVVLPTEALAASSFNLACLGHIHRAQKVYIPGKDVFYCGSINRITFNEEGQQKGFWVHELDEDWAEDNGAHFCYLKNYRFVETPAREFLTEQWNEQNVRTFLDHSDGDQVWLLGTRVKDKIIRVHYSCSDELNKQLNRKALEKALYDAGAFYVAEIAPAEITATLSKQELSENTGPLDNLVAWALAEGYNAEETKALVDLAQPLVETISAKMPTGKLSGIFEPLSLEVKNYRSYVEETFDFTQVSFATVNGPNGVGKSAFFMDSISDCLFEEPREGDLTGWISNGAKSGAITFTFAMGDSKWRVVRSRSRSGKTTLSLQEMVDGQWVDRSADKVRDTQAKIISLLGMDAMTFRCCGLIMQDAYGLFLEADKGDRMDVLANILGLGIYEQLMELAKAKVTETNRELERGKAKLEELQERLKDRPALQDSLDNVNRQLVDATQEIETLQKELAEANELLAMLEVKKAKAADLGKRYQQIESEIESKRRELRIQESRKANAEQILASEERIITKAQEYEQVKEQVTTLKAKQPLLEQVKADHERISRDLGVAGQELININRQIREVAQALAEKEDLEKASADYSQALVTLNELDAIAEQYNAINNDINSVRDAIDTAGDPSVVQNMLETCRSKVAILNNSNCIDPENARCRFLADAQEAKKQIPLLEAEIAKIEDKRQPLFAQLEELQKQQEALNYNWAAHNRAKKVVAKLRPIAERLLQMSSKEELMKNLLGQKAKAEKTLEDLKARDKELLQQYWELKNELEPLQTMEERLPKLEQWVKAKEALPETRAQLAAANEAIEMIRNTLGDLTVQYDEVAAELGDLNDQIQDLDNCSMRKQDIDAAIKRTQDIINQLHAKQGALTAKLEALAADEEERQQVSEKLKPTSLRLSRYQALVKAFGGDGIPFSIVRSVVPELESMANEILSQMTGGQMSLEMRTERIQKSNKKEVNALEIWITDYMRGSLPYQSRSGGQKVKAALSVAFALADLKARRAGIQLGMLSVDEPPFLDAEGVEAYCDALEVISRRYPNMKVIAISHDPRMKARFPQQIEVTDQGEAGSKIRVA